MTPETQTNHLYEHLSKLNVLQFKQFYCLFVHYRTNHHCFISQQNLFNLWCELNLFCHESDESFPDQYDDHEAMKSFCMTHPYYFIDKLPIPVIAELFARYVDDRIGVLLSVAKALYENNLHAAYTYANNALKLNESIDTLVSETHRHIHSFP